MHWRNLFTAPLWRQSSLGSEFEDVIVNESSSSNNKLQLVYELAAFLQHGQIWPCWRKAVAVPEVLCTPDDVCDGHPK